MIYNSLLFAALLVGIGVVIGPALLGLAGALVDDFREYRGRRFR